MFTKLYFSARTTHLEIFAAILVFLESRFLPSSIMTHVHLSAGSSINMHP